MNKHIKYAAHGKKLNINSELELIKLAAKAANYQLVPMCDPIESGESSNQYFHRNGKYWNPLYNDSDAFRLAIDIRLDVCNDHPNCCIIPFPDHDFEYCQTNYEDYQDMYEANRYVITIAAAIIGKKL